MMRPVIHCSFIVSFLAVPSMGFAIEFANGSWSTSFEYSEACTQRGGGGGVDCDTVKNDGIEWSWGSDSLAGNYTQATAAANNPNGSGGLGYRHWVGDGLNNHSGESAVTFPARQSELWIRWYMRYEEGFAWAGDEPVDDKWLYLWVNDNTGGRGYVIGQASQGGVHMWMPGNSQDYQTTGTLQWGDIFGQKSDGLFHMIEVYMKMDTDRTDGVFRLWADGNLIAEQTDVDYSNGNATVRQGVKWFEFHSNQKNPIGGPYYVDYDDMAIYTTDPGNRDENGNPWIGPLNRSPGNGSAPRPMPPVIQ